MCVRKKQRPSSSAGSAKAVDRLHPATTTSSGRLAVTNSEMTQHETPAATAARAATAAGTKPAAAANKNDNKLCGPLSGREIE